MTNTCSAMIWIKKVDGAYPSCLWAKGVLWLKCKPHLKFKKLRLSLSASAIYCVKKKKTNKTFSLYCILSKYLSHIFYGCFPGMPRHHPGPDMPNFYSLSPGGVGQITPPLGWWVPNGQRQSNCCCLLQRIRDYHLWSSTRGPRHHRQ